MEIQVSRGADSVTIAVSGSLNTNTAPELEKVVEATLSQDASFEEVVFDFSTLDYISSAGLRVLMVAYKMVQASGGTIRIVGTSDEVQEVLDITGFAELFES